MPDAHSTFLKYLMLPHILLLYICGSYALMSRRSRSVKKDENVDILYHISQVLLQTPL